MDLLGDPLRICPLQMGWEITIELCPKWRFRCIDNPDWQFINGSVPTRNWTRSDCLEPLLILTIYTSVASSKVIKACFFPSGGCLSGNSSPKIPVLTTSWCSNSRTVLTIAFLDHGGLPLQAVINKSLSYLHTPAVRYTVNWWLFTLICINSHPTACCFVFWQLPVLQAIFKCTSWVIFLVTTSATSRWTNWCPCTCCVPMTNQLDVVPANQLNFNPQSPGWGGCVSMICWCGIEEEDDNEMKWEVLWTI